MTLFTAPALDLNTFFKPFGISVSSARNAAALCLYAYHGVTPPLRHGERVSAFQHGWLYCETFLSMVPGSMYQKNVLFFSGCLGMGWHFFHGLKAFK